MDATVIQEAKGLGIKLSQDVEEYLRNRIALIKGDVENINLTLLTKQKEEAEKEMQQKQILFESLKQQVEALTINAKEQEEKKLKSEKERIENLKKCVICSGNIEEAVKKEVAWIDQEGKELFVESSCFMNWIEARMTKKMDYTKEALKEWCESRVETEVST